MRLSTVILFCALVLTGLDAGFFYTWSFTVMQGLDAASPAAAVEAMNAVNANIRNGWFAAIFFGAPAVTLLAAIALAIAGRRQRAVLAALALIALAGLVAVTVSLHVPWNETLLAAPAGADPARLWSDYSPEWTAWNHLRTALGIVAFVLLGLGLYRPR